MKRTVLALVFLAFISGISGYIGGSLAAEVPTPLLTKDSTGRSVVRPVYAVAHSAPVGGPGGAEFADRPPTEGARVAAVMVRAGRWIDSVQLLYQSPDGRRSLSSRRGGAGGAPYVFTLQPDEHIVAISGRYGRYVYSIQIHTNKRASPAYGGSGGVPYRIEVPAGYTVIGFVGRAGAYLDAVGLALRSLSPVPQGAPAPQMSPGPSGTGQSRRPIPGAEEKRAAEAPAPAPAAREGAAGPQREERTAARQREEQTAARAPKARAAAPKPAPLPNFPWPPPVPSEQLVIPDPLFRSPATPEPPLSTVGARLTAALEEAKYYEYSYYRVPNGFALVARLERISDDGTPMPEKFRFLQPGSQEPFSFAGYIRQLFFAPEGFYRQIVFVVTDQPFAATGAKLDSDAAAKLLSRGANRLSGDYDTTPFTAAHRVSALIYEFRKGPREGDVSTLTPGRLGARMHLDRAGIYPALSRRP